MTVTFVGAGTATTSNNATVTPTVHPSTAARDVVVIITSTRATAGATATPAGWSRIGGLNNLRAYARVWQTGDTVPTFTPVGTAAGDDVIAQIFTFRGVEPYVPPTGQNDQHATGQTNASAQNIAFPTQDLPADRHVAITAVWKQDDATSLGSITSFTQAQVTNATAGNDALQAMYYWIQTNVSDPGAGTITVTGGGAAVSEALVFYLRPAAAIAISEQSTWPPRVLVTVTDLTLGDSVVVYREVEGERTELRAGSSAEVTDTSFLVLDAELPFGVPVSYVAVVNDAAEYASATATYTLSGGNVAVTDAVTGLSSEVKIQDWPSKDYERKSTKFAVGGRSVVVASGFTMFSSEITLFTETTSQGGNLEDLLRNATEGTIQIRSASGNPDTEGYVVVTGFRKERYDRHDSSDQRRLWVLDAEEVESWAPEQEAAGYSYADLDTQYAGQTYADLAGDYATYLALATAELGA